jgi:esterase/lipase superfamily enzyme
MPLVVVDDAGFELKCGKRIPTGIFLGSYLSPVADSVENCAKRCKADNKCTAFSLDNRDPPASRTCTLFGSVENLSDANDSVAGVRIGSTGTGATASPGPKGSGNKQSRAKGHLFPSVGAPLEPPKADPNSGAAGGGAVTLTPDMKALQPVYFTTDRKRVEGAPLETSFAGERNPDMTYGRAIVSIPKSHHIGNVERPKFSFIKFRVAPETDADDFRIKDIAWLDRGALVDQLKGGPDSVLLFVHGYNSTFADAVFKAAQIAYDANFAGTVLVFSWPSAGGLFKYDQDRESAAFAEGHLAQTFRLLSEEIGKKNVYIVAHSMGNQVLVNALLQSALSKANLNITELAMAAPDVDKDVFASKVDQIRSVAKNITLYASAADKALLASGEKSFGTRLGYVGHNGPNVFKGIDVIDVTAVGDDMLGLDHGTFSSSREVLDDLGRLIRSPIHLAPGVRTPTLQVMPDTANIPYWLYPR